MAFTRLNMVFDGALTGGVLRWGLVPGLVVKLAVCWVLELVLFLLTIPFRVMRAAAHPLQLQQGIDREIETLRCINVRHRSKTSFLWHRAEYIVDRYVFHAPVCIISKLGYRPKGGYKFKDIPLSKTEGFREWTESVSEQILEQVPLKQTSVVNERLRLENARHRKIKWSQQRSDALPKTPKERVSTDIPDPTTTRPHPRTVSNPVELVLAKQSHTTPIVTLRIVPRPVARSISATDTAYLEDIIGAIQAIIPCPHYDDGSLAPILLRLAWHCCATYDRHTHTGGSNGATMRFSPELTDEGNTGLHVARAALEPIKARFPRITYSDLWTLAGKVAVESMGGPTITWKCGRVDCTFAKKVPPNGRLPFGDKNADHIRATFDRMGFDDGEMVALLGAHGMGRCHPQFSGWDGRWTRKPTEFTNDFFSVLLREEWHEDVVASTGRSQYFNTDKTLMMLNTDMELVRDPGFRHWVEVYTDNEHFRRSFSAAFAKLLELGVRRDETGAVLWRD